MIALPAWLRDLDATAHGADRRVRWIVWLVMRLRAQGMGPGERVAVLVHALGQEMAHAPPEQRDLTQAWVRERLAVAEAAQRGAWQTRLRHARPEGHA